MIDLGWIIRPLYERRLEGIAAQRQELVRRIQGAEHLIRDHQERLAQLYTEETEIQQALDEGKVSI